MAIGLLAGLAYAGIGAMEGANKLSAKEKELTDRTDELSQKASDVRMTAEHKRLATKWDENDAVIKAVGKSGYTTRSGQYRLAKHAGDVSSLEEFDSLRGDTVWELPKQGARPELNFADVTKLRAKRRTGADYLSQAVGLSDQETYTGSSVVERERELLKLDSVSYRRATDEDKASVLERRATEKRLSDLSKGVKQRFLEYKNNLAHHPRIAAEVEGLEGKELESKLLSLSFNIENIDVTTTGTVDKADVYFKSLNIDDTGITLQLTNTEDAAVNKINGQINAASNQITISNDPATNAKIKTKIKALEEQKATHIKTKLARGISVDASIAKNDATARTTDDYTKFFASRMNKLGETIKGVSGSDLTTSKYRNDGYKKTGASGSFTKEGVHLSRNLDNAQLYAKGYAAEQARNDMKIPLTSLTFESYNDKIVSDLAKRTFRFTDTGIYDTEAVFSIPYPSTNFKGIGYQDNYNLDAWKSLVADYVEQAGSSANDSDAALQDTLNDLYNGLRDGSVKPPSSSPEVPDVVAKSVVDVASPTPIVKAATVPLGTIRDTSKGKLIKTTKGWIPYSNTAVAPNTPSAPVVEEAQEVPAYQQIADIKLAAHNAESDIKQQASLDLQAATKQTSKDAIAEAAKASIAKLRSKLKNDLAQFTGN